MFFTLFVNYVKVNITFRKGTVDNARSVGWKVHQWWDNWNRELHVQKPQGYTRDHRERAL